MQTLDIFVLGRQDDPELDPLRACAPEVRIHVSPTPAEHSALLADIEAALYWKGSAEAVRELVTHAPRLRWLHSSSAGVEGILKPPLVESSIVLTNSAGVYAPSLAEWSIMGMLYFAKQIPRLQAAQRERRWEQFDVAELRNKQLTILGYGGIGQAIAVRARAMGMRVVGLRRRVTETSDASAEQILSIDALSSVLPDTDYLAIAAPLTPETRGLVNDERIRLLKPSAVVVNVGRGPIIDEGALVAALTEKRIRGAALDVFATEPLPAEHPLWGLDNVLISPHSADHTDEWLKDAMRFYLTNLARYRAGEALLNIVDKSSGY